jgi:mRNA-degrading endonuclease YafQ of YafQ-DinJ toxin-antitoxin module
MDLIWSPAFTRAVKRRLRRQPDLRPLIEKTLRQLTEDPFHPSLHSHKLQGNLAGIWACSAAYDLRIIFEFTRNPETDAEEIFLLTIGTHDEVY